MVDKRLEFRFQARYRDSGELDEVDGNGASAETRDADVAAGGVVARVHHVTLGSFAARANLDEGLGLVAQPGGDLPFQDGLVVDADVGDEARLVELEEDRSRHRVSLPRTCLRCYVQLDRRLLAASLNDGRDRVPPNLDMPPCLQYIPRERDGISISSCNNG